MQPISADLDELSPLDARIADELGARGYAIVDGYLASEEVRALAKDLRDAWRRGELRRAGIGRGPTFRIAPEIRTDHVQWLDETDATEAQRPFLARAEALRRALNARLLLGLFGFEAQLALYAPGDYYKAHLDRFRTASHRAVTATLYLNEDWGERDGGALRLYLGEEATAPFLDVAPRAGTLAVFASERFLHEVLPATRERLAITGWFTRRP